MTLVELHVRIPPRILHHPPVQPDPQLLDPQHRREPTPEPQRRPTHEIQELFHRAWFAIHHILNQWLTHPDGVPDQRHLHVVLRRVLVRRVHPRLVLRVWRRRHPPRHHMLPAAPLLRPPPAGLP